MNIIAPREVGKDESCELGGTGNLGIRNHELAQRGTLNGHYNTKTEHCGPRQQTHICTMLDAANDDSAFANAAFLVLSAVMFVDDIPVPYISGRVRSSKAGCIMFPTLCTGAGAAVLSC